MTSLIVVMANVFLDPTFVMVELLIVTMVLMKLIVVQGRVKKAFVLKEHTLMALVAMIVTTA